VLAAPAMRVGVGGSVLGSAIGNVLDDRIAVRLSDDVAFTLPAVIQGNRGHHRLHSVCRFSFLPSLAGGRANCHTASAEADLKAGPLRNPTPY